MAEIAWERLVSGGGAYLLDEIKCEIDIPSHSIRLGKGKDSLFLFGVIIYMCFLSQNFWEVIKEREIINDYSDFYSFLSYAKKNCWIVENEQVRL